MQTVQRFTFPTFMGICSILAAFADILQNPAIFAGILIALFVIGAISIIVPARWVTSKLADTVGFDSSLSSTLKPFGLSCLMLAGLIYVFSALSAGAEAEGGALAKAFPEIEKIQLALGRVEKDLGELRGQTVAIKQDTGQLVETSLKWISVDASPGSFARTTNAGVIHYFPKGLYVNLTNETGQTFEDVSVMVSNGETLLFAENVPMLLQDGYKHFLHDVPEVFDTATVCVTGKRRGKSEWFTETRVYKSVQRRLEDMPSFDVVDVTDLKMTSEKPRCST
ncbi:hypothetical protein ELI25_04060 [Rhizobium ruizarguesonis]|uniref:hypothetical protein n=1 Tax=Rhizobium ruizarguesonis TaxID=2081791 RepID=UPI0010306C28|nr:hypothetical protein [Rhizobium ruizarguesonis]TAW15081.1 hypothetical protein ELI25_04060 [Rhizobium ruizarguesonis]